jgi:hypothetical protein
MGIHLLKTGVSDSHLLFARWLRRTKTFRQSRLTRCLKAHLIDIPGNSMVLVVASDYLPKPCTDLTDKIMLPAEKLNLDGLQPRNQFAVWT